LVIARKDPDSPVYEVKPEFGRGGHRTLRLGIVLPCDYFPADSWPDFSQTTKGKRRDNAPNHRTEDKDEADDNCDSSEDCESDNELYIIHRPVAQDQQLKC
jgi:hypothetical protein